MPKQKMTTQRSADYRKRFIDANPGPWRCRYCGRHLKDKSDMTVDHVVPVAAVSKFGIRALFWRGYCRHEGIQDINEMRNLVPACRRCNSRKGQKTGIWLVRAVLGKYPAWFAIRTCLYLALAVALVALLLWICDTGEGGGYRTLTAFFQAASGYLMHTFHVPALR